MGATLDDATTGTFRTLSAIKSLGFPEEVFSLILECQFPDTSKKFPVLARREFDRKTLTYISETKLPPQFGGQIRENSLYFPGYQGIWLPRQVRCSLPAQPPSRGFSASLHTFARRSRRSPELRH